MADNYDPLRFEQLVHELNERYSGISLPPEFAELFEVNTLQLLIKLARYKFAARILRAQDKVLEAGSGSGVGTIFLAQHVRHVTGIEINQGDYEAACKFNRRDNVEFLHQSIFDHHPDDRYDAVVSLDVIEHLPEEEGRKFVGHLASLCKPDGMVIIGTPSIYSYPYQGSYSQAAHVKCYDRAELNVLVDSFFGRTIPFSMNDEIVHTGHPKLAWYYFALGLLPKAAVR